MLKPKEKKGLMRSKTKRRICANRQDPTGKVINAYGFKLLLKLRVRGEHGQLAFDISIERPFS